MHVCNVRRARDNPTTGLRSALKYVCANTHTHKLRNTRTNRHKQNQQKHVTSLVNYELQIYNSTNVREKIQCLPELLAP